MLRCSGFRLGGRPPRACGPSRRAERIAGAEDAGEVAREIDALPRDRMLCESGRLGVWLASAAEIPHALREIGRLREISFRGSGEGTGRALDLDRFDEHYRHLFLWNAATRVIAC